jgi:hypothetical protein
MDHGSWIWRTWWLRAETIVILIIRQPAEHIIFYFGVGEWVEGVSWAGRIGQAMYDTESVTRTLQHENWSTQSLDLQTWVLRNEMRKARRLQ